MKIEFFEEFPSKKSLEKLKLVKDFVESERMEMGVTDQDLEPAGKPELSCYAMGEFKNLLYRQLIYTQYGYGAWIGLEGGVLDGLIDYIQKVKRFRER